MRNRQHFSPLRLPAVSRRLEPRVDTRRSTRVEPMDRLGFAQHCRSWSAGRCDQWYVTPRSLHCICTISEGAGPFTLTGSQCSFALLTTGTPRCRPPPSSVASTQAYSACRVACCSSASVGDEAPLRTPMHSASPGNQSGRGVRRRRPCTQRCVCWTFKRGRTSTHPLLAARATPARRIWPDQQPQHRIDPPVKLISLLPLINSPFFPHYHQQPPRRVWLFVASLPPASYAQPARRTPVLVELVCPACRLSVCHQSGGIRM